MAEGAAMLHPLVVVIEGAGLPHPSLLDVISPVRDLAEIRKQRPGGRRLAGYYSASTGPGGGG